MYSSKNISVIIPTLHRENFLKTYHSLLKQSVKIGKIVIVNASQKKIIPRSKNSKIIYSKKENQVYQRSLGLKYISKKTKILLLLDDRVVLKKDAIKQLLNDWNSSSNNVAGIGLSCINYIPPKIHLINRLTLTNSKITAKVLKSGFVSGYGSVKEKTSCDWLNGGMTSWRIDKVKKYLFKRNFPMLSWCVGEDLVFSYNIKKKYELLISSNAKCILLPKKENLNNLDHFCKGFYHSYIIKSFVKNNNNRLSLLLFYYAAYSSSFFGIVKNILTFNCKDSLRFLGRIVGSFFYYKKIS
jgi:glycosyltransferase involved in cell wall biosynthesis